MSAKLRLKAIATGFGATVVTAAAVTGMVLSEPSASPVVEPTPTPVVSPTVAPALAPELEDFTWRVLGESGMTEVRVTVSNSGDVKAVNLPYTCATKSGKKVYTGEVNGLAEAGKATVLVITTPEDYTELGVATCTPGLLVYR
jgi:hypothetical protein